MSHHYTTKDAIARLKSEVNEIDVTLNRLNRVGAGDREGFEALKEQVKEYHEMFREKKNSAIDLSEMDSRGITLPTDVQIRIEHISRGKEIAFKMVLDIMEGNNDMIQIYKERKEELMAELKRREKLEQRPTPSGI